MKNNDWRKSSSFYQTQPKETLWGGGNHYYLSIRLGGNRQALIHLHKNHHSSGIGIDYHMAKILNTVLCQNYFSTSKVKRQISGEFDTEVFYLRHILLLIFSASIFFSLILIFWIYKIFLRFRPFNWFNFRTLGLEMSVVSNICLWDRMSVWLSRGYLGGLR